MHSKSKKSLKLSSKERITIGGLVLVLLFIIDTSSLFAQSSWRSFNYRTNINNVVSLIPQKAQLNNGYTFFGTSVSFDENVITKGYEPFREDFSWRTNLNEMDSLLGQTVYLNVYSNNVAALILNIHGSEGDSYQKKIAFSTDGYQIPFEWLLDVSSLITRGPRQNQSYQNSNSMPYFHATIELRDSLLPYKFVIGDAKVYKKQFVKVPSEGLLFYELTKKKENRFSNYIRRDLGNAYPFEQLTDFVSFKGSPFSFELDCNPTDSITIQKTTLELIRAIFQKYQFYEEHKLDKQTIINSIDKIISNSFSFDTKIQLLEAEAKRLHDGHFYFQTSVKNRSQISSPLMLKRINGVVQIVGIRDERLKNKIELGDIVHAIDEMSCKSFVDSLSADYFGNRNQREELAISHLLDKPVNSPPLKITLEKSNGHLYDLELMYDVRFPAPKKFVPEHFGFKYLDNGWAYLKINKWDRGDWIKFYNLRDSLETAEGIVFDLRGNPGGYEVESINIASSFAKKPFVYSVHTYSMPDEIFTGETIVKPNAYLDLSDLKVIVIVDNKTGCASESFTLALKENMNATVVGASQTSGAYSTVFSIQLPKGIQLWTNVFGRSYMLNERITIEGAGIQPDIKVEIQKYTDLYGYEDTVLKTVQKLIDRSI